MYSEQNSEREEGSISALETLGNAKALGLCAVFYNPPSNQMLDFPARKWVSVISLLSTDVDIVDINGVARLINAPNVE